jgi:alkylation response protein AidB-like acyl-CoA dehydrogenase
MAQASDTIGAVLQNTRQHIGQSVPSTHRGTKAVTNGLSSAEIKAANQDKAQWEWVEVPDHDLFGEPHTGVSINFEQFGPGRYFVSPEMAGEIKRLLENRQRGDIRVLQPRQDVVMARIMSKSQLGAPINANLDGLNDK